MRASSLRTAAALAALASAIAISPSATAPATASATASAPRGDTGVPNGDVIANLWSWNWKSVGAECGTTLDPAGYGAVWVAPPAESLKHPDGNWWDVYQPYSYKLNGRFGTRSDFAAMVKSCHDAGVKVYTDAVINHTAAQTGTGYDGTTITDKYHPPMYTRADYNVDVCDHAINDWSDLGEVQNCELLDLPDLKTGAPAVRARLAGYLNSQLDLGVDGFRIDAAKHMPSTDLEAIFGQVKDTAAGGRPFIFHEVFPGEPPAPGDYFGTGRVLDFTFADKLKAAFQGDIAGLESFGDGLLPAADSVSFVTNHDTERDGRHLSYKDGDTAKLANLFQLAWKHAPPTVYAGFEFDAKDQSPPASGGMVTDTDCENGWYCLNRGPAVTAMVGWRGAVGDADVTGFQSPAANVIGFGRGETGFVAINNGGAAHTSEFATGLPDGAYCNVIDECATKVTVTGGRVTLNIPAKSAVAFHTDI